MAIMSEDRTMPIAVVGLSCRFPGDATSPEKFWRMLLSKKSAMTEVPPDRYNIDAFYHPDGSRNGTANNRGGHFMKDDISAFDAGFFSISPAEAISMDPMQRMLLEVVYEATENAGITLPDLAGSNTGVFVGCWANDYDAMAKRDAEVLPKYHTVGTGQSILSNRVSFCFDLHGPSMTIDTACSSSLVAVHLACQSLKAGESTVAIVGATNALLTPEIMVGTTNLGFLSPTSISHAFDSRADGYSRGEGVAAVILKPLHHALRDGDTIRAVIRGTAMNSNGRTPGITLPSREAQIRLIRSAYAQAGCDMTTTAYIEAHGTGTQAGDPIEASAIAEALGKARSDGSKLYVGSVKTNVGHLEGTSGLAGLIKAVLSVEAGLIAPNIWFEKGNPNIDWKAWKIRIPTEPTNWPTSGLRRVSINGFGYGGTNGHVIIDDAYHYLSSRNLNGNHHVRLPVNGIEASSAATQNGVAPVPRLFLISAHDPTAFNNVTQSLGEYVASNAQKGGDERFLNDLSFSLCHRRTLLEYRSLLVAATCEELVKKLDSQITPTRCLNAPPRIAFVFTGQGAQWWAMGRELVVLDVFRKCLDECEQAIREFDSPWHLVDELLKDEEHSRVNEAVISQPLCTALQMALVDLLASWNIHPDSVVGHSSGEIAAAYAAGILPLRSAMKVAYFRGLLVPKVREKGYKGGMLAVGLSESDALTEISEMEAEKADGKAVVACVNSPLSVTMSGDLSALSALQARLTSRGVFARKLFVDTAYHSHHMLAISQAYRSSLDGLETTEPSAKRPKIFSSVTGEQVAGNVPLSADYWVKNMTSCVRFNDAVRALCNWKDGQLQLVELGPHAALAGPVKQIMAAIPTSATYKYLSVLARGKCSHRSALEAAASLIEGGFPASVYLGIQQPLLADIPSYRWNHTRKYWSESRISRDRRFRQFPRTDILGAPADDWNPLEPRWRGFMRLSEQPWLASHVVQGSIVYPAGGFCCMALQAAQQIQSIRGFGPVTEYRIRELVISQALLVPQTDEGVEVVFSLRIDSYAAATKSVPWHEFHIFSYTSDGGWAEHCRGLVSTTHDSDLTALDVCRDRFAGFQVPRKPPLGGDELYKSLDNVGIWCGPEFRSIVSLLPCSHNEVFGTVQITQTGNGETISQRFDPPVPPATIDALFHLAVAAFCGGSPESLRKAYVPTFIRDMAVSNQINTSVGHRFEALADAIGYGSRDFMGTVSVLDADSHDPVIRIGGMNLRALPSLVAERSDNFKQCGRILWKPDPDLLNKEQLESLLSKCSKVDPLRATNPSRHRDLELLAYSYTHVALQALYTPDVADMPVHHRRFFAYLQKQRELACLGLHEHQTEYWTKLEDLDVRARIANLKEQFSREGDSEGQLLIRMGEALVSVLRQQTDPLTLMMEGDLLSKYYKVSLGLPSTYAQVAEYIKLISHKNPNLEYLEIGAGTGGCTAPVVEALAGHDGHRYPRLKSYTFTDISTGFFEKAMDELGGNLGHLMKFKKLDIEQDPSTQGFGQFDVVIAANVLHATRDIELTMKHVRKLLRPGGKVILIEITHKLLSVGLIFGNLSGWWRSCEPWRDLSPLLDESQWTDVLVKNAFTGLQASSPDVRNPKEACNRVMIATAIEPKETNSNHCGSQPQVIILKPSISFDGSYALLSAFEAELTEAGIASETYSLCDLDETDLTNISVVSFVELRDPLLLGISAADSRRLQRVANTSRSILWITRGATRTKPELSLFQGLGKSLRARNKDQRYVTLDLDCEQEVTAGETATLILNVYKQSLLVSLQSGENTFIEQSGSLHIGRLVEDDVRNQHVSQRTRAIAPEPEARSIGELRQRGALSLKPKAVGGTRSLAFEDISTTTEPLANDQVQIDVQAVGLTSRDVSAFQGEVVDDYLGDECAGIVRSVGSGVKDLVVGDRVVAWSQGTFATTISCRSVCVRRIPDTMPFTTAAAIPVAYVTAYYSLVHIAHLAKGESVLIQVGSLSDCHAAIQVAQECGAIVYVVVDSEEDKLHLINTYKLAKEKTFSHRTVSLAYHVWRATGGAGVDVVLDSMAGYAAQVSWNDALARFGRVVQLGQRDFGNDARVPLIPSSRNTTSSSVDMASLWRAKPQLAGDMLAIVMDQIAKGAYRLEMPVIVEPISKAVENLKAIQAGTQMGKIVLEFREDDLVQVIPRSPSPVCFPEDASYILAGDLDSLGSSISRWMVLQGARNFICIPQQGVSSKQRSCLAQQLKEAGARVSILDSGDNRELSSALLTVLKDMPPLRGVVQLAMGIDDTNLADTDHVLHSMALHANLKCLWAIHEITVGLQLDFFLLISSTAASSGYEGQSEHIMASSYQSALGRHRRSLKQPATSIDIGLISSATLPSGKASSIPGLAEVSEPELLAVIETAIRDSGEQIVTGVTDINSEDVTERPWWTNDPMFSHLAYTRPHLKPPLDDTSNDSKGGKVHTQISLKKVLTAGLDGDQDALFENVLQALVDRMARALMIAADDVNVLKSPANLGADSLVAVEVRNWLVSEAGIEVPVFDMLQAPSLSALAASMLKRIKKV